MKRRTEKREWLIRPHQSLDYVTAFCYDVHKIGYYDLREAPEFPEIWPVLSGMLNTAELVVIHNDPFDPRHLRAALMLYHLPAIRFPYDCSLAVSRKNYPEMHSHSLDAMASFFDHEFQHHDVLEDAIACAAILFIGVGKVMLDIIVSIFFWKLANRPLESNKLESNKYEQLTNLENTIRI